MAPYEVTRPLGISRTTSYTCSKKEMSFPPPGKMERDFSVGFFEDTCKNLYRQFTILVRLLFVSAQLILIAGVQEQIHSQMGNACTHARNNIL